MVLIVKNVMDNQQPLCSVVLAELPYKLVLMCYLLWIVLSMFGVNAEKGSMIRALISL